MKICFWGDIARALKGNTNGGGELQMALLAITLAKSGHEVIAFDTETLVNHEVINGVKVYTIEGWNDGIRIFRTLTHRMPNLYTSLRDQKADIYYCRVRDFRHLIVYWAARKAKAKFILGVASDSDISTFRRRWKYFYSRVRPTLWGFFDGIFSEVIYPFLLHKSDHVFVQHTGQQELLEKQKIKSVVFPNLINLIEVPAIIKAERKDIIYVGSIDKRKGFIQFFELVQNTPFIKYRVVGKPRSKTGAFYFEKLKLFENVTLLGKLNHIDTLYQIAHSKALVSTSPLEGFPNIFIEAWACGIPVLSLFVDPGGVIQKNRLGEIACGNMEKLILAVKTNNGGDDDFASRAKEYVDHYHALNPENMRRIGLLFEEIRSNTFKEYESTKM